MMMMIPAAVRRVGRPYEMIAGMARARKAARIIKYKARLRSRKIKPECNLPHEGRSECHV